MKIKKVLSLGIVLGTVLSVGMVVSASAAIVTVVPSWPTNEIKATEYPLNSTTLGVAGTDQMNEAQDLKFTLGTITETGVKVGTGQYIAFTPSVDCYVTIIPNTDNADKGGEACILQEGETDTTKAVVSLAKTNDNATSAEQLIAHTNYYLVGTSGDGASIEELEFSVQPLTAKILGTKGKGTDNNQNKISIVRDGTTYYGVVVFDKSNLTEYSSFSIADNATKTIPEGMKNLQTVYEEVKFSQDGPVYDANYFGSGQYLYAFKLTGTAVTGDDGNTIKGLIKFYNQDQS